MFILKFLFIFSFTESSHFLGGSFTYKHIERNINYRSYKSILVEIRFHVSHHFYLCTPEEINQHAIVYLVGENILYDNKTKEYLWNETIARKADRNFYDIKCISERHNSACQNFQQQTWGYCESVNKKNGYSILTRQFLLIVERYKPLNLYYSACCWANSTLKSFYLNLSIETYLTRINSSPYPHIPASYYVALNKSNTIKIIAFDADGDEILCEPYQEDLSQFLTVVVDHECRLNYKISRVGKQFGQFWLMDRYQNRILSRSLISIQVHVLDHLICADQPDLIIDSTNKSMIHLNDSIDIIVRLQPNCHSIKPQDQTITEITTLCTNHLPITLPNGGIEVRFECQLNLCKIYQICFVGEIGFKLPATSIHCDSIEVTGSKNECINAASEYRFDAPHNRHFIIAEEKPTDMEPLLALQSRRWIWVIVAHLIFLFAVIIVYCGCKQMLSIFYNRSISRIRVRNMAEFYPIITRRSKKSTEIRSPKHDNMLAKKKNVRTQHLRLGSVDYPNRRT